MCHWDLAHDTERRLPPCSGATGVRVRWSCPSTSTGLRWRRCVLQLGTERKKSTIWRLFARNRNRSSTANSLDKFTPECTAIMHLPTAPSLMAKCQTETEPTDEEGCFNAIRSCRHHWQHKCTSWWSRWHPDVFCPAYTDDQQLISTHNWSDACWGSHRWCCNYKHQSQHHWHRRAAAVCLRP